MSIIKSNQSAFDISTQINGDVRSVLDFCIKNNLSLTEEIPAGTTFVNAETEYENDLVQSFFFNRGFELATSEPKQLPEPLGIGTMAVGSSFVVS